MAPLAPARLSLSALGFVMVTARRAIHEHIALAVSGQDQSLDSSLNDIKFTSVDDKICGGVRIWSLLTEGIVDSDAVKNIDWPTIGCSSQHTQWGHSTLNASMSWTASTRVCKQS